MKFYIQSGYEGKETSCIALNYDKSEFNYSARNGYEGEIPVGSVEFVENILGYNPTPNYYPSFLEKYFHREIRWQESLNSITEEDSCFFIKPADKNKRFESRIACYYDQFEPNFRSWQTGPYWFSDIVHFKEEWRYYIANGEQLAAYWYKGEEREIEAPELNIKWPKNFCGAVDFGRLYNEKLTLVENNFPYACGWYGSYSEGKIYGEWLEKGWNYVLTKIQN